MFLLLSIVVGLVGCSHVKSVNSPEAHLRYQVEAVKPGKTIRVEKSDGTTSAGVLSAVEWPQATLLSGEHSELVDMRGATGVWEQRTSKRRGQKIGAITGAVIGVVAGIFIVGGHTPTLYSDSPTSEPEETFGDYLGGATIGGLVFGGLGALVGGLTSDGELVWTPIYRASGQPAH